MECCSVSVFLLVRYLTNKMLQMVYELDKNCYNNDCFCVAYIFRNVWEVFFWRGLVLFTSFRRSNAWVLIGYCTQYGGKLASPIFSDTTIYYNEKSNTFTHARIHKHEHNVYACSSSELLLRREARDSHHLAIAINIYIILMYLKPSISKQDDSTSVSLAEQYKRVSGSR